MFRHELLTGSETGGFDFFQDIIPDLGHRYSPIVQLSREDEQAATIHLEAVVVPLNDLVQPVVMKGVLAGRINRRVSLCRRR